MRAHTCVGGAECKLSTPKNLAPAKFKEQTGVTILLVAKVNLIKHQGFRSDRASCGPAFLKHRETRRSTRLRQHG